MEGVAATLSGRSLHGETDLCHLLRSRAAQHNTRLAYRFLSGKGAEQNTFTYGELDAQARIIGGLLQSMDAAGEPVGLVFPAGLDFVAAFFGVHYAGAIAVPLSASGSANSVDRMKGAITDANARIVLTLSNTVSRVRKAIGDVPGIPFVTIVPVDAISGVWASAWQRPGVSHDALAVLQYTSGSTASPKGVRIRHSNLLSNAARIARTLEMDSTSVGVSWLPHHHDMGLVGGVVTPLYAGFPVTLMAPTSFLVRPACWLEAISRYRATVSASPNFGYELCAQRIRPEDLGEIDLGSWRTAFSGAEPVQPDTLRRFADAFASRGFQANAFFPCYGLAEATLMVAGSRWHPSTSYRLSRESLGTGRAQLVHPSEERATVELTTSGQALEGSRLVIVDPDRSIALPPRHIGEIWVSGESVGDGYWNRPIESEQTFGAHLADNSLEGPFLRTGDLGFVHEGTLFVTGRIKDLLVVRGVNHYPNDIEQTLENCVPALRRGCGAVFSVEENGEERLIIVFEIDGGADSVTTEAVFETMVTAVARHHELHVCAIALVRRNTIPKTTSGKIQRQRCKADFLAGRLAVTAAWRTPAMSEKADRLPASVKDGQVEGHQGESLVQTLLVNEIAGLLGRSVNQISPEQSIHALGMDSLLATRLLGRIEDRLGLSLEISDFLEALTIEEAAARISHRMHAGNGQPPDETWASLIERVEHLSDEEVVTLLERERALTAAARNHGH